MPIKPIPDRFWQQDEPVDESAWQPQQDEPVPEAAMRPLLGGAEATMGQAPYESPWAQARRTLQEAFFGHPDRAEMKAAGVGMQPTPAELAETALAGLAAAEGGQLMAGGVSLAGGGLAAVRAAGPRRVAGALAEVIENPRGLITKPLRRIAEGGAKATPAEAAPAAGQVVQFPAQAAEAASGAAAQASEMAAKVASLRQKGLSGAQIESSLRQLYPGYRPTDYRQIVKTVLEAGQ